jgi:arylsulfatase A-like enzyme
MKKPMEACVGIVDIFPTICDILGEKIPFGVQGKSILPVLKGEDVQKEYDTAYAESGYGGLYWDEHDSLDLVSEGASKALSEDGRPLNIDSLNSWTQSGHVRMLRKGQYKIQVDMLGHGYLYDLKSDPMEIRNLFNKKEYLPTKADMLSELVSAMLRACDPMPSPRRRYCYKAHPKGFWFQDYHC